VLPLLYYYYNKGQSNLVRLTPLRIHHSIGSNYGDCFRFSTHVRNVDTGSNLVGIRLRLGLTKPTIAFVFLVKKILVFAIQYFLFYLYLLEYR